ncbi:hypothetical protein SGFS_078000 [Streptomyces graminofaciens]|jgi:hypothetical protein|uniref:Uncharacterized protein n=1 Tax=Streptomyces graminofaciens TaxID=68212 RepID=A0ABM7FJQ5_9ACTN|nr:hypothetical protein SGFS_078000 [Streptomyces graminofaciens]
MPMIRLTAPTGALTEEGRTTVQRDLAAVPEKHLKPVFVRQTP